MYNMLFRECEGAHVLLALLGLTRSDVPRYRDCWLEPECIAIYTRMGGGNRECQCGDDGGTCAACTIDALAENPLVVSDKDDTFDTTYRTLRFSFPDEYAELLKGPAESAMTVDTDKMWRDALAAMKV